MKPFYQTVQQLSECQKIPSEYIPACHLIYSAPATLSYNSPGAIGFGVKRAGLVIPESVMLLVSPASCGRNSTILSQEEGYADRMFYLLMNETDLVTGRHLRKLKKAIEEIIEVAEPRAKVIVICITCVDALLATDLESLSKKLEAQTGVLIVPSYMYALEREGRKPPMTAIRQTIYSLLKREKVNPHAINLLGYFSEVNSQSELFTLLKEAGISTIHQVAKKKTLEDYYEMGASNFNLVLHSESLYAAEDLKNRLNMPYIELPRIYDINRMHRLYQMFGQAIGISLKDEVYLSEAKGYEEKIKKRSQNKKVVLGEMANANPFELACVLEKIGLEVCEIFANVTKRDLPTLKRLAALRPNIQVYTGISPSMVHFQAREDIDFTIGKDAGVYYPDIPCIPWNEEVQPFGYQGFIDLCKELERVL